MKDASAKAMDVVLVGKLDRKSATDFGLTPPRHMTPEAVEAQYAATGDLSCPFPGYPRWGVGQAQVTLKNNVLTTAAHVFFRKNDCTTLLQPSKCEFVIRVAGKEQRYGIEPQFKTGYKCPHDGEFEPGEDWMVLKLKRSVDARVKAYGVRREQVVKAGDELVSVGKSMDWPTGDGTTTLLDRPRHYGDCSAQYSAKSGSSGSIETDCDASKGNSGGSLLSPGASPDLLAVTSGQIKEIPKGCDTTLGHAGSDTYHEHCWANFATAVDGEFRDEILRAGGEAPASSQPGRPSINDPVPGFKLPPVKL